MEKLSRYGKDLNLSAFVLDCSVTISWFMPDESFDFNFLNKVSKEGAIVPSLWSLEIGNVLLMSERKMRITLEQRQKALHVLTELPIIVDTMTSNNAWLETMELAERYNLTLYDASYLELSLRRSLPLATFDKQLKKAAGLSGVSILP
ncbi:MAG: type II toxin-antitoxin system VapC family toxin [Parachlamydiaceae bacterium]